MPFTLAQQKEILAALVTKAKQACVGCGEHHRQLQPDLFLFSSRPTLPTVLTPPPSTAWDAFQPPPKWPMPPPGWAAPSALPCIAVICMNCGFTEFYNVHVLGVAAILGIPGPGVPLG